MTFFAGDRIEPCMPDLYVSPSNTMILQGGRRIGILNSGRSAGPNRKKGITGTKGGGGSAGGSIQAIAGTFVANTSTGIQTVSSVGFKPDVVIFTGGGGLVSGTQVDGYRAFFGFATATEAYSIATGADDNQDTTNTSHRIATAAITIVNPSEALNGEADLDGFIGSGFRLNWTTAPDAAYLVHYIALKGCQAKGIQFDVPTGTGNTSVTGAGFSPDALIILAQGSNSVAAIDASAAGSAFGLSIGTGAAQFAMGHIFNDGSGNAQGYRLGRTARIVSMPSLAGGNDYSLTLVSLDVDGFTYNRGLAATAQTPVAVLCLKGNGGAAFTVGSFVKPTGAAPQTTTITGIPRKPKGFLFLRPRSAETNDTGAGTDAIPSVGMASLPSKQGGFLVYDQGGLIDFSNNIALDSSSSALPDSGANGALATITNDGCTITWNPNDGLAEIVGWLAFG